ncbi:TOG array regulator of axonemal microtubules protein 1 isoform X2 [Denticeps clupeoides]|uniref:TOG array regulator of axonemal microtubules protein 1 isoform X2 n=1 Tax=Denticeps clupeoides TaxID=299321 RepID=UPI0010A42DE3|nr:TOG array regulator of axonemal microtubules protein 1 isoform X2 [Denticeps clupeoides]
MIYGLIPQELHDQLQDNQNYQNRTNGVEELKSIIFDLDFKQIPSDSISEFINFLRRLLDDSNFKVLHGTLQVINLLIHKLDYNVDKYYKPIVYTTLKTLGDARVLTRCEYMNVFRQLTTMVGAQKVLDLVIGQLKHKNSRVREDVINIITTAILTHSRKDFNIPNLCLEVAPYLADSKRKVRHAALELFALMDSSLDSGKKHPLMKAINKVELTGDVDGLMAAIQARRARHKLPRLTAEGLVEYALVIPKSGTRRSSQLGSGADLEWVLNGGRSGSAQSQRTEPDRDHLYGYPSLGSLTDDLPLGKRIVSAGKGKNKLPWERECLPCTLNPQPSSPSDGKSTDQVSCEDLQISSSRGQGKYDSIFISGDPSQGPGRRQRLGRVLRSSSLDSDPDIFKFTNPNGLEQVEGRSTSQGLPKPGHLPSGLVRTPTLSRRQRTDSSLSMSNTWPNKRENSPHRRDPSPWRNNADDISSKAHSFTKLVTPVPPPMPVAAVKPVFAVSTSLEHSQAHSSQRSSRRDQIFQTPERNLCLELSDPSRQEQEEESLDREEMLNSLRSLRYSAAKKRAKVSLSGSDPDSPDSAVRLEPALDSPSQTSPSLTSPLSESGLSGVCSPPTPTINGCRTSPGNSAVKPRPSRRASTKQPTAATLDLIPLPAAPKSYPEESTIGQRAACHNGSLDTKEDRPRKTNSPPARPGGREQTRLLRASRGSVVIGGSFSSGGDISGVVGRGVFGSSVGSIKPDVPVSVQQEEPIGWSACDPPEGLYGHALIGNHLDLDHIHNTVQDENYKIRQLRSNQQDEQVVPKDRYRIRKQIGNMLPEANMEESRSLKDLHLNGSKVISAMNDAPTEDSHVCPDSPAGPQSPVKSFSPSHKPSPPTLPPAGPLHSKSKVPRLRRASSLNRAQNSLDELNSDIHSQKKDPQEQPELKPISKPELALSQSFALLNSDNWEDKIKGMTHLRSLAQYHSDVLTSRLHDVCLVIIQEVKNLRSCVARFAVMTLGHLFAQLRKGIDQELVEVSKTLLHKSGETNVFIRQAVDNALDSMVQHCTSIRVINALLAGGISHLNPVVRRCTAQHLTTLVEKIGADRVLSGAKDLTERLIPAVTKLAQDSSQEARYFGRRILLFLSAHQDFEKILQKYISDKEQAIMKDTVFILKTKGLGEIPQDTTSARGRRSLPGSGLVRASSLTREPMSSSKDAGQFSVKSQVPSIADKTEYIKQITGQLESKDFRQRIRGIDQLVADCECTPNLVIGNILTVFDAFKARLLESNTKVNLCALEALPKITHLLKEHMTQVVCNLFPAIVDTHLNSKNNAIYSAALDAINGLIQNLDNAILLQPFCSKAQFLRGKAKVDLINKVSDLVNNLYPLRPQVVEQKVLPLLWHLLGTSPGSGTNQGQGGNMRGAIAHLCEVLDTHMGPALTDCSVSQSISIQKSLNELVKNSSVV